MKKNIAILGIIAIAIFFIYKSIRNEKAAIKQDAIADLMVNDMLKPKSKFIPSDSLDSPLSFGYKTMWFAVKSNDKERIIEVLNLKKLGRANWQNGIANAYDFRVFITPEVNGWTLITGIGLPGDSKESIEKVKQILKTLSNEYGAAQFFGTHRVVEYHSWMKATNGTIERVYSYLGESGENIAIEGNATTIEKGLNLVNTFSEDSKKENYFDTKDLIIPDEELVMKIANSWSINPTELETQKNIRNEYGLVCEFK